MTDQHITDFIGGFYGGNRTNRFQVTGNFAGLAQYGISTPYHIRATTLPSAKIGVIPISYRGRVANYPGDRTYDPWTVLVLDDVGGDGRQLYKGFHDWHNDINGHMDNLSQIDGAVNFGTDITVEHLDVNGGSLLNRNFRLINAWPVEVGPIQLDIGQMDTLVTFQVTFVFTHYDVTG
jgi:hypothetical protein